MIEINITGIEEEAIEMINILTINNAQEIRKAMIKFAKENYWPDSSEYGQIIEFINDFFVANQSQLEDESL
jgi:hypothetical protein